MAMTASEKIIARASGKTDLKPDDVVVASVDRAMSHDSTAMVLRYFGQIGTKSIWDPDRIVVVLDHRVPANTIESAEAHKIIRKVVGHQGIKNFFDVGEGICHLIMIENGFVKPGELIVGTDSHSTTYGAFGALGTGIGATEMASAWATGKLWLKVPETIKINYSGEIAKNICGKDIILFTLGKLGVDFANYKSIEYSGDLIPGLSINDRITISNMSVEMGAKCSIMPFDTVTEQSYSKISIEDFDLSGLEPVYADADANYKNVKDFDLSELQPQVACPNNVDNVKPVDEISGEKIQQAFLGSCTNGSYEDLKIAAEYLKGSRINKNVRMYVVPGTRRIYLEALKQGLIEIFISAGCVVLNPGCGPCMGAHQGLLASGETAISSSNRNFRGRMGSPDAKIFLASPATVSASALEGAIINPEEAAVR